MDFKKNKLFFIIVGLAFLAAGGLTLSFYYRQKIAGNAGKEAAENNAAENDALKPAQNFPGQIYLDVPFTPQAPFGNWEDVRQDNGCEEACLLMAMAWVNDKKITPEEALKEILAMVDFQLENYGHFHDTSAQDTFKLLKEYFKYENAFIQFDIGAKDIKNQLAGGNLVIVPIDGSKVNNPFYTPPGPDQHKILIRGYEDATGEFISNDPGTSRGEGYRYKYEILESALMDYKSGFHEIIDEIKTAMIVVKK